MKITVLYDSDGVIIAGAPRTGDYDDPVPVASDDNRAGTFDVPQSAVELRLDEICTSFRVDPASQQLVEEPRK
jgi:hypothetical protein